MSKKKKMTVWHKRKGKFIPPSFLKAHIPKAEGKKTPFHEDRRREKMEKFAEDFSAQIKKAVREGS